MNDKVIAAGPGASPEELLGAIAALQQEVLKVGSEPQAVMKLVAQRARQLTGADGTVVELANGDEWVYGAATGTAVTAIGLRLDKGSSLSESCVSLGQALSCEDAETDPRVDAVACQKAGIRSIAVAPLLHAGHVVGTLKALSNQPSAFGNCTVSLLQVMSAVLTTAMSYGWAFDAEKAVTARKAQQLRDHERRFSSFLDHGPAIAFVKDSEGRYVYANETLRRMFGWRGDEWVGQTDAALFSAATTSQLRANDLAVMASGVPKKFEESVALNGGPNRIWIVHKFPLEIEGQMHLGGLALDVTESKAASQSREETLGLLESLLDSASLGVAFLDRELRFVRLNPTLARITRVPLRDHLGRNVASIAPHFAAEIEPACRRVLEAGDAVQDLEIRGPEETFFLANLFPVRSPFGGSLGIGAVFLDITDRRRLETRVRTAQKLESLGLLAGGIAHDFNNLLTVINGYSEMLIVRSADEVTREMVGEINKAGERAASLTHQLLAFSRQQVLAPKILNLNEIVAESGKLLRRLIGEDIDLAIRLEPALQPVNVDAGQMQQVILNLALNARDAMPRGGRLTIETATADFGDEWATIHPEAKPGHYVLLTVSDTGCGMSSEVKSHIFEPFFTTKGVGKGTGLGLATVFGIVKQSGGFVTVYTEEEHGTIFKVHLPAAEPALGPAGDVPESAPLVGGNETVLVAEDDRAVRQFVRMTLESYGYRVLEAGRGDDALRIAGEHSEPIHLLISDVVMPEMGGRELADRIAAVHPEAEILYLSGYTNDAIVRHGVLEASCHFMQKPFAAEKFLAKVRQILDNAAQSKKVESSPFSVSC